MEERAPEEEGREGWSTRPEAWLGLLFLIVAVGTRGFQVMPDTIGALDERLYHLPTVLEFAKTWPAVNLGDYQAATGPTYHYLLAPIAKLSGGNVALLRAVTGALSMAAAWLVAALLRRFAGWRAEDAAAGAVLFSLAPYTLGSAFVLGTDNPALLFTFAAVYGVLAYRERPSLTAAAATGTAIALALTTRQTSAWLVPAAIVVFLRAPASWAARLGASALAGLGAIPLLLLVRLWGAPVPPSFQAVNLTPSSIRLTEITLAVGLVGLYGGILEPRATLRRTVETVRSPRVLLVLVALAGLWLGGRIDATQIGESAPVDGMLIEVASLTPALLGMSALLWLVLVAGLGRTVAAVRAWPERWLLILAPFFLGLCYVRSGIHLQRYCEGLVVLAVLASIRAGEKPFFRRPGYWILIAVFLVFALLKATLFAGKGIRP